MTSSLLLGSRSASQLAADPAMTSRYGAGGWFKIGEHVLVAPGPLLSVNVPSDYEALMVVGMLRGDVATTFEVGSLSFNGDTDGTHYAYQYLSAAGASSTAANSHAAAGSRNMILATGAGSNANDFASLFMQIPAYKSSVIAKVATTQQSGPLARSAGNLVTRSATLHWRSVAPITSLSIAPTTGPNWVGGSYMSVYGLKSAA